MKGVIESLLGLFPPLRFRYGQTFKHFLSEAISQSRLYTSSDEIKKDALSYSTIVAGSDQIWAPNVFNPVYMIDFVDGKKVNKVSYAASIGLNEIPEKYVGQYSSLLGDFTSLAVREEEGARLLKDRCGIVAILC